MRSVRRTVLWSLVAALAIAAVTLAILFYLLPPEEKTSTPAYTIGEWEGQVAVFEGNQEYPKQVFDSFVSALPEEQRAQVIAGIPVEDETQLSLLLEDLTS